MNRCGDAVTDSDEDCDDGNSGNHDDCVASCVSASCGDGFLHDGYEQCDDGGANSDTTADACRTSCERPTCGDGVVDVGEVCDRAGSASDCDADCSLPRCSDGVTNVAAGETCDDGNLDPNDGCSPTCGIEPGWVIYVDELATGANDGSSWGNAYTSLQDALAAANRGEIWVAHGLYEPDKGNGVTAGDRSATFSLKTNVALYGGFEGTEIARVQRGPTTASTITYLDGNGSYHVVTANNVAGAVLDSFTVDNGLSNDSVGGAGMLVNASTLTIANCRFVSNWREVYYSTQHVIGGALFSTASPITIENSFFGGNHVRVSSGSESLPKPNSVGAAIYVEGGSLTILKSTFEGNTADNGLGAAMGGAIASASAAVRIVDSRFAANMAQSNASSALNPTAYGGAIYIDNTGTSGSPSVVLTNTVFESNSSQASYPTGICRGGAISSGCRAEADPADSGDGPTSCSMAEDWLPRGGKRARGVRPKVWFGTASPERPQSRAARSGGEGDSSQCCGGDTPRDERTK